MPTVRAHVTKMTREEGNEFVDIFLDHDSIKKLATKRADLIALAKELRESGELAEIEYTDRPRTLDDGRTFHNYYFSGASKAVEENGSGAPQAGIPGIEVVPASSGRPTDPDAAWRMALSTGGKLAVQTMPLMPTDQRDLESQWRIATWWAERIFFTRRPERPSSYTSPLDSRTYRDPGDFELGSQIRNSETPPPYDDGDIPF